jgi:hypothetical protein
VAIKRARNIALLPRAAPLRAPSNQPSRRLIHPRRHSLRRRQHRNRRPEELLPG